MLRNEAERWQDTREEQAEFRKQVALQLQARGIDLPPSLEPYAQPRLPASILAAKPEADRQ